MDLIESIQHKATRKISDAIGSDVSVFPDEHLYNILVYGSNVFNSVSNGLM